MGRISRWLLLILLLAAPLVLAGQGCAPLQRTADYLFTGAWDSPAARLAAAVPGAAAGNPSAWLVIAEVVGTALATLITGGAALVVHDKRRDRKLAERAAVLVSRPKP